MADSIDTAAGHFHAGRMAEAIAACRAVLRVDPRQAEALNLLGAALFSTGDHDAAGAVLDEAVRIAPGHDTALTNLIVVRLHRRAWAAAERCLRRLAVLDPGRPFAWSRLGTALLETGDLEGSVRGLLRAVRLTPSSDTDRFNLGTVRILAGDFDGAVDTLRRVIAANPNGVLAHVRTGEMLLRLGRPDRAATAFQRALRLDPGDGDAANGLARARRYAATAAAAAAAGQAAGRAAGGLVVRGPFTSATGYGHFCQRLTRALLDRGVPLQTIGIMGPESWAPETLDRPVPARAVVNCLIPLAVEPVPGLATVTFSMFEGTRIPMAWRRQCERSDLIVVPCESSRLAWAGRGFPEDRLRVCPLGVDGVEDDGAAALTLVDSQGRPVSSYRHRFLNVSDFIPRKNVDGLLRVWLRATARGDDAVLILKLGKGTTTSPLGELGALVRLAESAVGKRMAEAAPVVLIDRLFSDAEMTGLYKAASHYWSLSHGEGWDLPMSKAGTLGLGLIAPRHSAYVDYLDDRVAHMIPAAVGPAHLPGRTEFYQPFHGLDWWNPDEDAAAGILAGIIRGTDAEPRSARARLLERFTWERSADRLLAILDDAGLR